MHLLFLHLRPFTHTWERFCIETHLIFWMIERSRFLACVHENKSPCGIWTRDLCEPYVGSYKLFNNAFNKLFNCHKKKKKLTVLTPDFTRQWFSLLQTRWVPRETMADGLLCIWARDESSLSVSLYLYIYRYICLMMTI